MDIDATDGLRESIAQAMQGAFDKPPVFKSYYPSRIPRVPSESTLGDTTTTGSIPYPDPDDTAPAATGPTGGGGVAGGDIEAVMYLASEGALVNVTLKGTIDP